MKNDLNKKIDNLMISAQTSKEKGDLLSTLNYLNEILKLDSNNKRALNNIGNAYKETKKFDEAVKYYSKAINSDPNYVIAKINLAILHHDLGNLDEAEKFYKELIVLDKYNFAIYFNLSRINFSYFDENKINFIESNINSEKINNYNRASGYFILAKNEQIKAALHLHHRGNEEQALELIRAGLFSGITEFDSSIGGLGGCPFTENSGANISTESLVRHLTAWGFDCGVNKAGLTNASQIAEKIKLNELAIVI